MNFSQGHSGTKVQCESCLFSQGKTPEFTKMGEIHELFVFPLSLVWFAGATPDENLVAHDYGYPLSRYTCRATRVAADFLDFRAFCRCSTGVALHPLKNLVAPPPPPVPGGVAPKFGSEKVSRCTGVSQLQLRVSRYTVQLSPEIARGFWRLVSAVDFFGGFFGPFSSLENKQEKIHRKNPPKNPRFSRELFDQSPLRENSALTKGVRSVVFVFGTLLVTFWSLFSDASVTFSVAFCQTPFARLLLRQGEF